MRFCADASFLVRLYDPLGDSADADAIREYLSDDQKVVTLEFGESQMRTAEGKSLHRRRWPCLD